ncbi:MAG: DUF308 domain-containing protein [Ktedonobacteraceae bacterium]
MHATHQRIWWMELTRGILTFTFGLLFLTSRSFAPRLFIYSLGVYLVIDGVLEIYGVHNRQRISQVKMIEYFSGAMSLLAGLLSLIFPTFTLLLLAAIIAIRLIYNGFLHMRTSRNTLNPYNILSWIYNGLLALLGIFLLLFPLHAITILVVFLGSYMLIAGFILLLRGLSLRFSSSDLPSLPSHLPQVSPELREDFPPTTRRAVVFVRRKAAYGLGHIAWGFEWTNGWFNLGSVENTLRKPFTNPRQMDFWSVHTLNPSATIQNGEFPYDEYKLFFVTQPHPKEAWKTVIWESQQPYAFVHHNCCDATYEILHTYGCTELLDPAKEYIPNDWYDALPGTSYLINEGTAIPVYPHMQSRREVKTREIVLSIPARMKGTSPLLVRRWRAWEELTLVWEMMIGHILSLCTLSIKIISQRLRKH